MPSKFEIPCVDSCMKILFDALEISTIIKLWIAVLTEKQVRIRFNKDNLDCESMFPYLCCC
jgi:hypothetical protein